MGSPPEQKRTLFSPLSSLSVRKRGWSVGAWLAEATELENWQGDAPVFDDAAPVLRVACLVSVVCAE